jgi:hypothetical protein
MREVERQALLDGSAHQALPLNSIDGFEALDQHVWNALLRLEAARRQGEAAEGLVEFALGAIRATALLLASHPRPQDIRARVAGERKAAIDSLKAAYVLGVVSKWSLDAALDLAPSPFVDPAWYESSDDDDEASDDGDGDDGEASDESSDDDDEASDDGDDESSHDGDGHDDDDDDESSDDGDDDESSDDEKAGADEDHPRDPGSDDDGDDGFDESSGDDDDDDGEAMEQ